MANTKTEFHRLSKEDEAAIYELVLQRLTINPNDNQKIKKYKTEKQEEYRRFCIDITPKSRGRPRNKGPRRLCYEHLPELADIADLTYLDLLRATSRNAQGEKIEPRWSTEIEETMCGYCDLLTPARQHEVLALVKRIIAPKFLENRDTLTPIQRLAEANNSRTYCATETFRQVKDLDIELAYQRRLIPYSYNALEFGQIAYVAAGIDVSPHWLLGLDETRTVLARTGGTELIMDLYCLLSDERKDILLSAVQTAAETGGTI